ncbi:MAG: AEC family transporter [Verrucomicrobiaceae bacterium]|nr:AEC family transporter [Verrucomicrobiaceae bacterium]
MDTGALDLKTILYAVLPVYLIMVTGALARRWRLLPSEVDAGLMRVSVQLLFPCLIVDRIVGNQAVMSPAPVLLAAGLGFSLVAIGMGLAYSTGPLLGLRIGSGRRTFALSVGVQNYGFVAIPVIASLFPGNQTVGVMFTFTLGVELAVWLLGVSMLTGMSQAPWRAALNAPVLSIVGSLLINFAGAGDTIPTPIRTVLSQLGACSVPLSVMLIGASIHDLWGKERFSWPVALVSPVLRLGVIPLAFAACIWVLPLSMELKRVLVVQAAMPSAVFGIVLARMYGGHAATAVQVVLATTLASLLTTPWVIALGIKWLHLEP